MNQAFKVGDIVKVKNPTNMRDMYLELEVSETNSRGHVCASAHGTYITAVPEHFELVRSAPASHQFTEEEVKALCEKAWNAGIDYINDDSDFPMGPGPYEKESPNFEQFWNANKPQ